MRRFFAIQYIINEMRRYGTEVCPSQIMLFAVFKGLCCPDLFVPLLCFTFIYFVLALYPDRPFCSQISSDLCDLLSLTVYFLEYIKHFSLHPSIFHNSCP